MLIIESIHVFILYGRTFVGTWNVHGSAPTESFKDWLQGTLKTKDGKPVDDPDFYVIG
jgi:hypothetical protein